jgi:2,3-diaminopropionate biosynthesis protein SbnB
MRPGTQPAPRFHVVPGRTAYDVIFSSLDDVVRVVEAAYRAHAERKTINPDSYFLRFPDRDKDRIIALPAHLDSGNGRAVSGVKWISSFPGNLAKGLPRASAALILNDATTGYPLACLEASIVSAARTAASAVLAAFWLNGRHRRAKALGIIGAGLISRYIVEFFIGTGWRFEELHIHDLDEASAQALGRRFGPTVEGRVRQHDRATSVIRACDLTVFATTATSPYVQDCSDFDHRPIILHVSLRDLSPAIILSAHNVVDDVDHCLKANTSPHLAEQKVGNRDFVRFTLPEILCGADPPDRSRPIIFSPFGMGILDIAVGLHVLEAASVAGTAAEIPEFFYDLNRA